MKASDLFAKISISDLRVETQAQPLNRTLGPLALIALGIGAIIGTGIFVITGVAAAEHAGPAIVISFVIAGLGSVFAGLCYAEFSSMVPVAGSAYAYSYATLGECVAWFVGWNLVLEYLFASATCAVGWSRYFVKLLEFLHVNYLPSVLSHSPFALGGDGVSLVLTGDVVNLPAVAVAILLTALCHLGIRQSATVNGAVVTVKVAIILMVIGFGAFYVSPHNWHPFIPPNTGRFGDFGWSGVLRAAGIVFYAYIGFDAVSTASQEARNPTRDVPIGILGSLAICTILYIAMSAILTGLVPYRLLNDAAPVEVVALHVNLDKTVELTKETSSAQAASLKRC